jgi:uncharacterized protein YndB with AHSA1/START domain
MSNRSFEKTITIDAPVEAVWKALTDAERITRWFAPEARVTPGAGGSIWMSWGPGFEGDAKITIWDEHRHLRTEDAKKPMAVDYVLEAQGGGSTTLRLVQSFGEGNWDDEFEGTNLGWTIFLDTLKAFLERRSDAGCRQAIVMCPVSGTLDEAFGRVRAALDRTLGGREVWSLPPKGRIVEVDALDTRAYVTLERFGGQAYLFFNAFIYAAPTPRLDPAELEARVRPALEAAARG